MATIDLGPTIGNSGGGSGGGGSGSVTEVDTGSGLTGGPITTTGTISIASVSLVNQVVGNLPVTNLNAGTSANASTFWRGDGTWSSPAGSSGSAAGTVTQLDTGAGLFGGPITTTGTISVASVSLTNQVVGILPILNVASVSLTANVFGILPVANSSRLDQLVGSVSLTTQVVNNLPLSQTSGSISLTNQVVGNLPLSQTSGSISLTAQVSGVLPAANSSGLNLLSGSVSLTNQVVGNLPLSQTSGSISLTSQVSGILPVANSQGLNALTGSVSLSSQVSGLLPLSQTSGSISLVNQVVGNLPLSQTSGSISLTTQVSGLLPVANSQGLNALVGSVSLSNQVSGSLPLSQTSGSVSLVNQVTGLLPAANITANNRIGSFGVSVDGGGAALTAGVVGYVSIPYACTITSWVLFADQSGTVFVDLWKVPYASFPPLVANTITAGLVPNITGSQYGTNSILTGWTTSVSAGDVIGFNVSSVTSVTRVNFNIKVTI